MAISEITPLSIRPEVASAANDVDIDDRKEAIITKTATEDSISAHAVFEKSVGKEWNWRGKPSTGHY